MASIRVPLWVVDSLGAVLPALLCRLSLLPRFDGTGGSFESRSMRPCVKGRSPRPPLERWSRSWSVGFGRAITKGPSPWPLVACVVRNCRQPLSSLRHPLFVLALVCRPRSSPWRRRETLQALQEPLSSPSKPTRRGVTTRNLPSATGPRKRVGSIRRRRRSSPRRTSAARARRGNPVGLRRLDNVRAQATPRPTTHTSSSTRITRTAWCTASSVSRSP